MIERPGWWFQIEKPCLSNLIHHPVCAFGADTSPGQEGRSLGFAKYVVARLSDV